MLERTDGNKPYQVFVAQVMCVPLVPSSRLPHPTPLLCPPIELGSQICARWQRAAQVINDQEQQIRMHSIIAVLIRVIIKGDTSRRFISFEGIRHVSQANATECLSLTRIATRPCAPLPDRRL